MSVQSLTWAIEQDVADPAAKLLLIIIANRTDHVSALCWPSVRTLAKETGLSEASVRRKSKLLEKLGLLAVEIKLDETGRQTSNHYRLPLKGVSMGGCQADRGGYHGDSPPSHTDRGEGITVTGRAITADSPYEPSKEERKQERQKDIGESLLCGEGGPGGELFPVLAKHNLEAKKPQNKRRHAKEQLPIDFNLEPDGIQYANESGFSGIDLDRLFARFKDHHIANGSVMASWPAAWRKWVQNELIYNLRRNRGHNGTSQLPAGNAYARIALRMAKELAEEKGQ